MFTTGETRQAWVHAKDDGYDIKVGPDDPAAVGILVRLGYLRNDRLDHLLPAPRPLLTRGHRISDRAAARRARLARIHAMRPHRTVTVRAI